jgi:hypothetical protein
MPITDPRLLPFGIKIDIEDYAVNFPELGTNGVMEMLKERLKCDFTFTEEDLIKYIEEIKEKRKIDVPLPVILEPSYNHLEKKIDKSPVVDLQNNAAIFEYFKKEALERMQLLKDTQTTREEIIVELEMLYLKHMELVINMVEKQTKLKLNFQDSNKYKDYLKERIDTLFLIIKSSLKETVNEDKYKEIINVINEKIKLFKW